MAIDLQKLSPEQTEAITEIATVLQDHADTAAQLDTINLEIASLMKQREQLRNGLSISDETKKAAIEKAQRLLVTVQPVARVALAAVFAAMLAACSGSPTRPSAPVSAPVATVAAPVAVPVWPVAHPDGQFGHEDPRYPPAATLCPVDYWPKYNGWNWLCEGPYSWLREFPSQQWRAR